MSFGQGNNPRYGRDGGPRPPTAGTQNPMSGQGTAAQYYQPVVQYAPWAINPADQAGIYCPSALQHHLADPYSYYPATTYNPYAAYAPYGYPTPQLPTYATNQPQGQGAPFARQPHTPPQIDPSLPAAQMTNSTGGVGCEPGYNYFFPREHTKIHVIKSRTPPWQIPTSTRLEFNAVHVPCSTTVGELLKGFGCDNPTAKKNVVYEIVQGGGGRWYKGMSFAGDDKDGVKRSIKDVGWDASRTGHPGEKPVVCLYFTKD